MLVVVFHPVFIKHGNKTYVKQIIDKLHDLLLVFYALHTYRLFKVKPVNDDNFLKSLKIICIVVVKITVFLQVNLNHTKL